MATNPLTIPRFKLFVEPKQQDNILADQDLFADELEAGHVVNRDNIHRVVACKTKLGQPGLSTRGQIEHIGTTAGSVGQTVGRHRIDEWYHVGRIMVIHIRRGSIPLDQRVIVEHCRWRCHIRLVLGVKPPEAIGQSYRAAVRPGAALESPVGLLLIEVRHSVRSIIFIW